MPTLIVFFRLKAGTDPAVYENWARETDLPIVRGLPSVDAFRLYRADGLFGSDAAPPYDYVELIDIASMDRFGADVGTDTMASVAAQFRQFADEPVFLLTSEIHQERAQ